MSTSDCSASALIPAVDLAAGRVVRARGGVRAAYESLDCRLVASCEPCEVVAALCRTYLTERIYLADLDAIEERQGAASDAVHAVRDAFPDLELWLDAGRAPTPSGFIRIEGSETLTGLPTAGWPEGTILSLDHRDALLGPEELLEHPELWPRRVIVMTLGRVGADAGPDLEHLRVLRERAPDREYFLAGGVRGPADVRRALEAGAAGVLLASALYDRRIPAPWEAGGHA